MIRPFRQQSEAGILDRAAALFARGGFAKTSVQQVADSVGLSKTGLLHHFPSKDVLRDAVLAQAGLLGEQVLEQVRDLPLGSTRDLRAVEVMVDVAMAHPGLVALLLAPLMETDAAGAPEVEAAAASALRAFGVDPAAPVSERAVRVAGALSALAVLALAANRENQTTAWRPFVVATCFDALGHHRAGATPPDQKEA